MPKNRKFKMPVELNSDFISAAIHIAAGEPIGLRANIIPFQLRDVFLHNIFKDHFDTSDSFTNPMKKYNDRVKGIVAFTKSRRYESLTASETFNPGGHDVNKAFEVLSPAIYFDEGIPYLNNPRILNGVRVYSEDQNDDMTTSFLHNKMTFPKLYMAMPAYLPQSVIRTGDGRLFFSSDKPETLQQQLEEALTYRLNRTIENALDL